MSITEQAIGLAAWEHELRGPHGMWIKANDYEGTVGDRSHITRVEEGTLPTSDIAHLIGVRGETPGQHPNRQGERWDSLKQDIAQHGIQNPIFITVDHGFAPKISEGNSRRDAAVELHQESVPVLIHYFGHAEQEGTVHERATRDPYAATSAAGTRQRIAKDPYLKEHRQEIRAVAQGENIREQVRRRAYRPKPLMMAFDPGEPRDPAGRWFHGTSDVHGPGDVIDPSVEHRANFDPEHSEPKSVYIARKPKTAMHYAERDKGGLGEPHVYEVEPLGPHWTVAKGSGQHQTKSPIRIIRELPPGEREADLPAGSYQRPGAGEMQYNLAAWEHELRGYHGEWEGRDTLVPAMTPADGRKPLDQPGRTNGVGTPADPIDVAGDMHKAVSLMISGQHVRLNGPQELPALADEINRRGDEIGAGKGSNPPWDLGLISVKGTRLFTEQTTGIERANMPQLAGKAEPGSEAALLAGGANKFFIADPEFRRQLERDGISVSNERVPADDLRATQTQLTATEVAGIARAAQQGSAAVRHMLTEPIWVTKDNYVIDGHHRWAAGEVLAAMQHNFPGRQINVQRIGLPVSQAIPYANHFAERIGIPSGGLGGRQKLVGTDAANLTEQAIELVFNPGQPRDIDGRWTRFPGVGEAARTAQAEREGFSVSPRTGETPTGGYMVAQTGATHTYPESILDDHAALTRAIDHMIMSEPDAFRGKQTYLGGWVHDGKLWLEPSDHFTDRAAAVQAGQDRNQIAIFDLNHYEEIPTGGSGGGEITHHEPARSFTAEGAPGGAGGLRGPPRRGPPEGGRSPGHQGPAGIAGQVLDLSLAAWLTEKRGYHGEWVGGEGIALQALGIKSRKGWIRVPDRPTQEQLPAMLRPKNAKQMRGLADMLGSMTAAQGPRQASLMGHLKRFMSETASEGGASTESTVPPDVTTFADASADKVDHLYGGGHETFNGRVTEGSNLLGGTKQSGALAYLDWDGSMHLRPDIATAIEKMRSSDRVNPGPAEVMLHELTHGVTDQPDRSGADMEAYQSSRAAAEAEEGFTELGATFHAREFFEAMGLADKPTIFKGPHGQDLTVGEVADRALNRDVIMTGTVWNDYPELVKRAYLWAEKVAQQRGVSMVQVVDEINRLGTASKLDYIRRAGVPWR